MPLTKATYAMLNGAPANVLDYGAVGDNSTICNTAFQTLVTAGGGIFIPDGQYRLTSTVSSTYASAPSIGVGSSNRYNIQGASLGNTSISWDNAGALTPMFSFTGATSGYGAFGFDTFGNCNLIRAAYNYTGTGIEHTSKAYSKYENLMIQGFSKGMNVVGSVFCEFDNVTSSFNTNGIVFALGSTGSLNNAIEFTACKFAGNTNSAIASSNGAGADITFLNCGFEDNGTMGVGNAGGAVMNVSGSQGMATVQFKGCYFEGNKGVADVYIDNTSSYPITVVFDGCSFQRGSSSSYTTQNIYAVSSGGGAVNVVIVGCAFFSAGSYVPSSSRPFVTAGTGATVFDLNSTYSETTSKTHVSKFTYPTIQPYTTVTQGGGGAFAVNAAAYSTFKFITGTATGNSLSFPTGGTTGQAIDVIIYNSTGVDITSWTFTGNYKVSTWATLANVKFVSIRFIFDGTYWIETSRIIAG